MKIIAIVGSLRKASFNKQLAQVIGSLLPTNVEFELLEYGDVPFFNEDIEVPAPASVDRVRAAIRQADAVWIFTPEYNHFFSGVLKNLLDWLSRPVEGQPALLAGKPVTVSGITVGMTGTMLGQDNLIALLSFLSMDVMNDPRVAIPYAGTQLDEMGNLSLTNSLPFLENQVHAFVQFVETARGYRG